VREIFLSLFWLFLSLLSKMEKEKRGANFTKTEIDLLIDIMLKYKHIIENKRTDATTWKDKNEAWD